MSGRIVEGDSAKILQTFDANIVDAVVTDPPYGLTGVSRGGSSRVAGTGPFGRHKIGTKTTGFMGKEWDGSGIEYSATLWREVFRVMKPGAHLLAFGGTRTYHRMVTALEDAGFEIRDMVCYCYGSGFPKSIDIPYAIGLQFGLCRSFARVPHAVAVSKLTRVALPGERTPIALVRARILPGAARAIGIRIGEEDGSFVPTAMCWYVWPEGTNSNTASSWKDAWAALSERAKSSTTTTETLRTTVSRISKSLPEEGIPKDTIPDATHNAGCVSAVVVAGGSLTDVGKRLQFIPKLIALADATEARRAMLEHEGQGSALKPAVEPIVVARKPLSEKTVAANVLKWGTGALNIDASRVGTKPRTTHVDGNRIGDRAGASAYRIGEQGFSYEGASGRWPSNLVLSHHPECVRKGTKTVKPAGGSQRGSAIKTRKSFFGGTRREPDRTVDGIYAPDGSETVEAWDCHPECPVRMLDEQSGETKTGDHEPYKQKNRDSYSGGMPEVRNFVNKGDTGGASRFFYTAKASRWERNAGMNGKRNDHPTLKPIAIIRYLVRMVTPPGGTVLDPFLGSGTTLCAIETLRAEGLDYNGVGIEKEPEYVEIARKRVEWFEGNAYKWLRVVAGENVDHPSQLRLFEEAKT